MHLCILCSGCIFTFCCYCSVLCCTDRGGHTTPPASLFCIRTAFPHLYRLLTPCPFKNKKQVSWGIDLATEHERFLTEEIFKQPVIVYNYPKDIKAFYMKLNEDGKTVAAMDVLVPKVCFLIPTL